MTFQRGRDEPANLSRGPAAEPPLDRARLAADLEPRAARLERFVQGLSTVLWRFEAAVGGGDSAAILADFEAPDASHEALRVLSEASLSARHDLAVLRRDIQTLIRVSSAGVDPAIVVKMRNVGASAAALAARFESLREASRSWLATAGTLEHPPARAALEGLERFVSIAVRTLHDVAEGALLIDREDGHLGLVAGAASAVAGGAAVRTVIIPPPPPPPRRAMLAAAAGGAWTSVASTLTRASRSLTHLGAGVTLAAGAAVATVVLVAVLASNDATPGGSGSPSGPGGGVASASSSQGGIAEGSASPRSSPGDSSAASLEPGQSPPPTLAPGQSPPPTPPGQTPGPSAAPTPTPPGQTPGPSVAPTPPPTPAPTPTPTPDPGAAAAAFAARVTSDANAIDALLTAITSDIQDPPDFAAAKSHAQQLENLATAGRAWLQAHAPAACYQTQHTNALDRYADLIATAVAIEADADAQNATAIHNDVASGHLDVSALKQAATKAVQDCP